MDNRHADPLRRLYQADKLWTDDGHEPLPFSLTYYLGSEQPSISHPGWDNSWSRPSHETIDDLAEDGLVRVERRDQWDRTFSLTQKGRQNAQALIERLTTPAVVGDTTPAPMIDATLSWLIETRRQASELFREPIKLLDRAIDDGTINASGRDALASQILHLYEAGLLTARSSPPHIEQATPEQTLRMMQGLDIAYGATRPGAGGAQITIESMSGGQVAGRDITNMVFAQLLDRAYEEIDSRADIGPETKDEAKHLIDVLRGKAVTATGTMLTGAGGALVSQVLAHVLHIPVS